MRLVVWCLGFRVHGDDWSMATFRRFEDIGAWQKARSLTKDLYALTDRPPLIRDRALCARLRRASGSIMANVAEGFGRGGSREFISFLSIARGSAGEVRSHLYVALDAGFIEEETFDLLAEGTREIERMLTGLIRHLRATSIRGEKFKEG